ncbi:MAG: methyltransferase family protein [Bacteroidia bacterium]
MYIFYGTYIVWILSEIILNRLARPAKSDKQGVDKHTELYVWIAIAIAVSVGVYVSEITSFPVFFNEKIEFVGLAVIIIGIIIRFAAIRQLGRFFTVSVTIRDDHRIIQSGFYKYLRHPSYTGALLSFFGLGIQLNNWLSFFIVFVPILFAFIYRINIEEKVLIEQFGQQYKEYIGRTKRIIPFVY